MKLHYTLMVLGLFYLSGCYEKRYRDIKKVKKGMNVNQVIKIMGRPPTDKYAVHIEIPQ